jgi:hypothetical protein
MLRQPSEPARSGLPELPPLHTRANFGRLTQAKATSAWNGGHKLEKTELAKASVAWQAHPASGQAHALAREYGGFTTGSAQICVLAWEAARGEVQKEEVGDGESRSRLQQRARGMSADRAAPLCGSVRLVDRLNDGAVACRLPTFVCHRCYISHASHVRGQAEHGHQQTSGPAFPACL